MRAQAIQCYNCTGCLELLVFSGQERVPHSRYMAACTVRNQQVTDPCDAFTLRPGVDAPPQIVQPMRIAFTPGRQ